MSFFSKYSLSYVYLDMLFKNKLDVINIKFHCHMIILRISVSYK